MNKSNDKSKQCLQCDATNASHATMCRECGFIFGDMSVPPKSVISDVDVNTGGQTLPPPPHSITLKIPLQWVIVAVVVVLLSSLVVKILAGLPSDHTNSKQQATPSAIAQILPKMPAGIGEVQAPDGEWIGINDGTNKAFITGLTDDNEKSRAIQAFQQGHTADAVTQFTTALEKESDDAEALIYLENLTIAHAGLPVVTLVSTLQIPNSEDNQILQGIYTAQHDYNQGNHGVKVRVLIANLGRSVQYVQSVTGQIVDLAGSPTMHLLGVIGCATSKCTFDTYKVLSDNSIPLISQEATSDNLSGISQYFFRIVPPNKVQALAAATLATHTLQLKTAIILVDQHDPFSLNLAQDFQDEFEKQDARILNREYYTVGKTDSFKSLIMDALKQNPGIIYLASTDISDTAAFENALPDLSNYPELRILSGDGGYAVSKNIYNRLYFTSLAYPDEWSILNPTQPEPPFFQEYGHNFDPQGKKPAGFYGYNRPTEQAMLSYDATGALLHGLGIARTGIAEKSIPTPKSIADALAKIHGDQAYQGVTGQIDFDDRHDPINKAVLILYVDQNGLTQMRPGIYGCFSKGCKVAA